MIQDGSPATWGLKTKLPAGSSPTGSVNLTNETVLLFRSPEVDSARPYDAPVVNGFGPRPRGVSRWQAGPQHEILEPNRLWSESSRTARPYDGGLPWTYCQPNRPLMQRCPLVTEWSAGEVTFTMRSS